MPSDRKPHYPGRVRIGNLEIAKDPETGKVIVVVRPNPLKPPVVPARPPVVVRPEGPVVNPPVVNNAPPPVKPARPARPPKPARPARPPTVVVDNTLTLPPFRPPALPLLPVTLPGQAAVLPGPQQVIDELQGVLVLEGPEAFARVVIDRWVEQFEEANGRKPTAAELRGGGLIRSIANAGGDTAADAATEYTENLLARSSPPRAGEAGSGQ